MNHDNNHHNYPYNKPPKDHTYPFGTFGPSEDSFSILWRWSREHQAGSRWATSCHRATGPRGNQNGCRTYTIWKSPARNLPEMLYIYIYIYIYIYTYRCMHMYIILYDHIIVIIYIYISLLFHIWWYYDDVSLSSTVPGFMLFYINDR
jgi:hypothetical protein